MKSLNYCNSLTEYSRRKTIDVSIGGIGCGGDNPVRVQSMTTVDTMDTKGSVEQIIRMVDAGCEYVRLTAPSIKEAQNLEEIKKELRQKGYTVPLIADIHFTPNAAELAAKIVEKVRVNPGNYADKKRFEQIEYTDETYGAELDRIREKFAPLVEICKKHGTAMRIGTNHGSLSDRIMSRYGDTPLGMVESALEFIRICEDMEFYDIVISMKASNTQVMIQAYRMLVNKLEEEGLKPYPLHLGVTEAGEGEDGRIKSAIGIGTLLEDGLGDTVRVSLTEEPEAEAPVAQMLVDRYKNRKGHKEIPSLDTLPINPFMYSRRQSAEVFNIGDQNVPRVISDYSGEASIEIKDLKNIGHFYLPEPDKWSMNDLGADFIYTGKQKLDFMLPNGLKRIADFIHWKELTDRENAFPLFTLEEYSNVEERHKTLNFVKLNASNLDQGLLYTLEAENNIVLILETENEHAYAALRRFFFELKITKNSIPVIIKRSYTNINEDEYRLFSATDMGGLLIDGFGDGVWLAPLEADNRKDQTDSIALANRVAFGILQAARTRITKTEYISCPSCGRTLFDLQETTAMIRKRTDHLKGIKIGIMGCIVNGPGEMADADYGYVGSGKGKITLYKGKEVVKRGIPTAYALDELIEIIKNDDNWIEPVA
ncbi:MAG: (E)-4-hydroxy-3-methylbut-2-enyl-diphosphate synthase [Candidatus Cyclobacteriaceae bacterium M2_1C_046]